MYIASLLCLVISVSSGASVVVVSFFFFKQKTAYEMRISDWSSDVCSSDLSLKITFRALRAGAKLGFDECMVMEYRLSQRVMAGHDFFEGVRAESGRASCRERVCQYV